MSAPSAGVQPGAAASAAAFAGSSAGAVATAGAPSHKPYGQLAPAAANTNIKGAEHKGKIDLKDSKDQFKAGLSGKANGHVYAPINAGGAPKPSAPPAPLTPAQQKLMNNVDRNFKIVMQNLHTLCNTETAWFDQHFETHKTIPADVHTFPTQTRTRGVITMGIRAKQLVDGAQAKITTVQAKLTEQTRRVAEAHFGLVMKRVVSEFAKHANDVDLGISLRCLKEAAVATGHPQTVAESLIVRAEIYSASAANPL